MDLGGVETGRVYSCYCRLIHRIFMGSYVYPDDMKLHLVDNTEIVLKKKRTNVRYFNFHVVILCGSSLGL
jgi:hypothetical protein